MLVFLSEIWHDHRKKISFSCRLIVPVLFMLAGVGCNLSFYFTGWEDAVYGTTPLDKSLFLREEKLRENHKKGTLNLVPPDLFAEVHSVKYVIQHESDPEQDRLYITFFGTDTPLELYYNLSIWKEPAWTTEYPAADIRVHAGFFRSYMLAAAVPLIGIHDVVSKFLADSPKHPQILVAGHSAGGSHALICSFDLAVRFPVLADRIFCLVSGTPAVGNEAFSSAFERLSGFESCHRYINGNDQMPSLFTPQAGFVHVGKPYRIGAPIDPFTTSSSLWLTDHFISDYADSIRKLDP